ncbi:MAG: sulfotransferase [Caulobacterales bacterium 32-69-10]|nr:MAG: sulfotransferase [Caulobacterales bacterium 32-69-10]
MSKRVSFLVAGVQKGGTTALFDYLNDHPDLALPAIKEAHFFDDEGAVDWTAPDYRPYHALFAGREQAQWGEATPIYTYWPRCFERIADYNSAMKLVLVFRNPIERAWSHWRMEYARGAETEPFAWCIREGRHRVNGDPSAPGHHREFSYVERGFYGAQVQRLLNLFPKEQALFLRSEDLRLSPGRILGRVCDFLNAPHFLTFEIKESHIGKDVGLQNSISVEDREYLKEVFALDQLIFNEKTGLSFQI